MKITVDIPDSAIQEICRVTGESKKGPAIRKLVTDALLLKRREKLAHKFIAGEWGVELKGFEETAEKHLRQFPRPAYRHHRAASWRRSRHL